MVLDLEKAEMEAPKRVPQDLDGPLERPGASTIKYGESVEEDMIECEAHEHSSNGSLSPVSDEDQPSQISRTRSASVRSTPISIIPPSKRRGLLARFTIIPEVEKPYEYKRSTKWSITMVVALAAAAAPIGSSIFYHATNFQPAALPELSQDLHATPTITNLSVAMYMLSMSIFPLWWSSFSETLGRRTIYLVSFALFTLWNIVSAVSTSISMLIVMRVLGGGAAASVQAVGAGTIADIWESKERGRAMGIFYLGPLLGPLLAPILGGALSQAWGWRSTQWFQVIYGSLLFLLLTFCLPETLAKRRTILPTLPTTEQKPTIRPTLSRVATRQSVQIKAKKSAQVFKRCVIDPLSVLLYLRFPAVLLSVYLASITFGSLYMLNISIEQTFSKSPYKYTTIIIGLLYIPNSVGYVIASVLGGRWTDTIMHREARAANRYDATGKLILIPEDRMRENAWLAAIIFPGALVWYGWTAERGVLWIAPMIANFFFGVGSMMIFALITTMLTEFMPGRSSSGVAVNNFLRNIFSCVGGVIAQPIIEAIGNGWLFTILGVLCWISAFSVIWAMRRFGPRWRVDMERKMKA